MKLSSAAFIDATAQMCRHSGVQRTKLMVKFRPGVGRVHIRSTDGKTVLTTKLRDIAELKLLEHLLNQYVGACTRRAPQEKLDTSAKKKAKRKGK